MNSRISGSFHGTHAQQRAFKMPGTGSRRGESWSEPAARESRTPILPPRFDERQRATQRERSAQDLTGDDRSARVSFWWPWFQGRNDGDSREYRWISAKEKTRESRELHQNRTSNPVKQVNPERVL